MTFFNHALRRANLLRNAAGNVVSAAKVFYVAESAAWSIRHDGSMITGELPMPSRLCFTHRGILNSVIHFGSIHTFCDSRGRVRIPHSSNKVVVTWFHISPEDPRTQKISELDRAVDQWHTSCEITRDALVQFGVPPEKLKVIPLGVDITAFNPPSNPEEKTALRALLGIPMDALVVGSFQKDGEGFGEGNTPKPIKGPDIFCDVMEEIAKELPVHVLLSGPARGYVKNRLDSAGIPYTHRYVEHPDDLAPFYRALDAYLIGSRVEGGPKSVLEAGACGIPVISTPVGMAPEILDGVNNGFVAEPDGLATRLHQVLSDASLREHIRHEAPKIIEKHSWSSIAARYAEELYEPLIREL